MLLLSTVLAAVLDTEMVQKSSYFKNGNAIRGGKDKKQEGICDITYIHINIFTPHHC